MNEDFKKAHLDLVKWAAWCQGYDAGKMAFSGRDYERELEVLDSCETPADLVLFLLHYMPMFNEGTMRERWTKFRREARNRYYRRVLDSDAPRPCFPPCGIERTYRAFMGGS